jgi:hypothetical protein
MKARDERVIEALVRTARPLMLRGVGTLAYRLDSCIAACRIGTLALAEFGVQSHTIGVSYVLLNAAYRRQVAEDGKPPDSADDYREGVHTMGMGMTWDDEMGHFGIAVGARLLLDLSIDQMHRPAKDIEFYEPMVATMPARWKRGDERFWTHTDAYSIGIQAEPENKNFLRSNDWLLRERYEPFVRATVDAMRADLRKRGVRW